MHQQNIGFHPKIKCYWSYFARNIVAIDTTIKLVTIFKSKIEIFFNLIRYTKATWPHKMTTQFSVWDYLVLIVMLLISAGIGLYYRFTGGKQKTTKVFHSQLKTFWLISVIYNVDQWFYRNTFWLTVVSPFIRFHSVWWLVLCQQ